MLDHNIPARMRSALTTHQAFTAREMHWDLFRNGDLLRTAELGQFDTLLTADQSIFYQQNNLHRIIALVVLTTNDWEVMRWHLNAIDKALQRSKPGSFKLLRLSRSVHLGTEVE